MVGCVPHVLEQAGSVFDAGVNGPRVARCAWAWCTALVACAWFGLLCGFEGVELDMQIPQALCLVMEVVGHTVSVARLSSISLYMLWPDQSSTWVSSLVTGT